MTDNVFVRRHTGCPLCGGFKPRGLIACWPCFREYNMSDGNEWAEQIIADYDAELAEFRDAS
jgi:hypothetical protein